MATSGPSRTCDTRAWTSMVEPIDGRTASAACPQVSPRSAIEGLTARQRMQVYMHSTIFNDGGPSVESVYEPSYQRDLHNQAVNHNVRTNNLAPPEFTMPKATDARTTDLAGHAVVTPSSHKHHELLHATNQKWLGPTSTLQFSNPDALVAKGTAIKVVPAKDTPAKGETGHILKQCFHTHVDMQWDDERAEISREQKSRYELDANGSKAPYRTAKELKLHNLSSEMPFGTERLIDPSTKAPRTDLFFDHVHVLTNDSAIDRKADRGDERTADTHKHRKKHNLQDSQKNMVNPEWFEKSDGCRFPVASDEDPKYSERRRYEKNFSDMFGTEMPARGQVRGNRRDMTTSQTSTYLDTRNEICCRNADGCHGNTDFATTAWDRKLTVLSSTLNGYACPQAAKSPQQDQTQGEERTCWDSTCFKKNGIMEKNSELARRFRLKESHPVDQPIDAHYAFDMAQRNLGSSNMRAGLHQETSHAASRPASRNTVEGHSTSVPVTAVPMQGTKGRIPSSHARQAFLATGAPYAFVEHKSNL